MSVLCVFAKSLNVCPWFFPLPSIILCLHVKLSLPMILLA